MKAARLPLACALLAGCAVFEAPIDRDAGRITVDAGRFDAGNGVSDAGPDAGMIETDGGRDGGMVETDAGRDGGMDAGMDAGPPSCVVPGIVAIDLCPGDIVINEIDGSGPGMADFVEIYNRGVDPVDISGWVIADGTMTSPDVAGGVVVPAGTVLDPGRFIYVWCNLDTAAMPGWQTDMCMPGAPPMCLHSSWGVGSSGDYVYILDDSLVIQCELQYPSGVFADEAFGRVPDGATTLCPTAPTPGETNRRSTNPARG